MPSREDDNTEIRLTADQARFPWVEIVSGPRGSGRFFLRSGKNFIGRSRENDIVLEDSSVSRRHAVIDVGESTATVSDLGSRNGTKVAGQRIDQTVSLSHDTRLSVGLYELRFLTQEANPVQPQDEVPAEEPQHTAEEEGPMVPSNVEVSQVPTENFSREGVNLPRQKGSQSRKWIRSLATVGALAGILIVGIPRVMKLLKKGEPIARPVATRIEKNPGEAVPVEKVKMPVTPPGQQPVFLDFSSSPVSAQVFFGDKLIGATPFRTSTTLGKGKWYEARGIFPLPEIGENLEERVQFESPEGAAIIPINFTAKIGIFKVSALPRDAQLYLEAYFEKDPYKAKPIKFAEVVYGKPVYVPYGRYVLELRRSRQLADSQTYLDEVIYRREFYISSSQTTYTVDVSEDGLKVFPVQVTSIPPGAKVFVDEKEAGTTPFSGNFPLGNHLLTMKREGYFDFVQAVKMETNMPYVAEIQLKTSEAGDLVNKADSLMKEERFAEALPVLVEAFSKHPTPRETAQISYMVGLSYLKQKAFKEAQDYFLKAMEHDDFKYAGRLGIASLTAEQGDPVKALQLLVEVLASSEDPKVRADAGVLFQRLSPLKSVLYITSEPAGARVLINNTEASQITPLIVHDLGLGSYRIVVKKDAYEDTELKLNLGVSEFRPVVVKLRRIIGYTSPPETRKGP